MGRDGLHRHAALPDRAHHLLAGEVIEITRLLDAVQRDRCQAVLVVIGVGPVVRDGRERAHLGRRVAGGVIGEVTGRARGQR